MSLFMEKNGIAMHICYWGCSSDASISYSQSSGGICHYFRDGLEPILENPAILHRGLNIQRKIITLPIIALGFTMPFAQVSQTGAASFSVTIVTILIAGFYQPFVWEFSRIIPSA